MTNTERQLADCVGAIYEAAANGESWQSVGASLCQLTGAQRAMLRWGDGSVTPPRNLLMATDESETVYLAYYHQLNPYFGRARRDFADARTRHLTTVKFGPELVPEQAFLRSEFYCDYARHHERRHLLAGMIGLDEVMPVGLFRANDAEPFGAQERELLQTVLPHLQRALELRARLGKDSQAAWATRAALDALPLGVALVDAGLRLHFANEAGGREFARADFGLRALRSGPHAGSGVYLAASVKDDAATLRRLVASAVAGHAGGSMRVVNPDMSFCAVLVSPLPRGLSTDYAMPGDAGLAENLAMVVIRDLGCVASPSPEMLCEVFGFTRAEADVAAALSGGASAEEVARQRKVSLATVRSQIRSILGKSGSENLRDFERSMASLAIMMPGRPDES